MRGAGPKWFGAKGFYTLGVLREIEGMVKRPLHEQFDLIFGTSTGAIIAALLALGKSVKEISDLYEKHVPTVMQKRGRAEKSAALQQLAFGLMRVDLRPKPTSAQYPSSGLPKGKMRWQSSFWRSGVTIPVDLLLEVRVLAPPT